MSHFPDHFAAPATFAFYKALLTIRPPYVKIKTKVRLMQHDLKALELIYRNSLTEEELDLSLQYHNISKEDFTNIAMINGWPTNPVAVKNLFAIIDESPLQSADSGQIEETNKASIRRINGIFEHAVTKFQLEMAGMSVPAILDSIDVITKIRDRLTKLEYPLYGLNTNVPETPANPINIFLSEEGPPPGQESEG